MEWHEAYGILCDKQGAEAKGWDQHKMLPYQTAVCVLVAEIPIE
jgi:hypothetical protein